MNKQIKQVATKLARELGFRGATLVTIVESRDYPTDVIGESTIIRSCKYGYRKYTTGEYVSKSYRKNFGWRNTYYQPAVCHVKIVVGVR